MTTRPRSTPRFTAGDARTLPAILAGTLGVALLLGACSSGEFRITPPDDQPATMTLFVEIPEDQIATSTRLGPDFSVRIEDGGNVLNLTEARMAVDQIEFGRTSGVCVDSTASDDGDACNEALTNPDAFSLPVDQGEIQLTNPVGVEAGNYDRLEIDLHPATQQDVNLLTEQGFQLGASVRIAGSFNGSPLNVQFGPEASLQLPLGDVFPLEEGEPGAMTLRVDVESWFRDAEGNLIDPRDAAEDPELTESVEQNIIESLSATPGSPDPES